MTGTLLEQTRALHEDMERLERMIVKEFKKEVKSHREKLAQQHRVKAMLDKIQHSSSSLCTIYADEDRARRDEIAVIGGKGDDGRDAFAAFYLRLKDVRDHYRRFPADTYTEAEDEGAGVPIEEPRLEFSGEEGGGRYLDLHPLHLTYQNAKFGRQCEYAEFVGSLAWDVSSVGREHRMSRPYRAYLEDLVSYLESFYRRTQPLGSVDKVYRKALAGFEGQWEAGAVAGWEDRGRGAGGGVPPGAPRPVSSVIDLKAFGSAGELEALGGDKLKEALSAAGLKCGGTVKERAERLWSIRGLASLDQADKKLLAKPAPGAGGAGPGGDASESAARSVAVLELKLTRLSGELRRVIEETLGNLEKRATKTFEELEAEREEEAAEDLPPDDEEEDDSMVYNPLKLPLGPDGRPIPYWLWKLHGLQRKFACEICGNFTYSGRRAFEKHFKEPRHMAGMAALGIPNTKAFFEVTQIEDALRLWKTMQEKQAGGSKGDGDEEYEDTEGNVYDRRTWEDLRRQGII